jgi:hypothetical protein
MRKAVYVMLLAVVSVLVVSQVASAGNHDRLKRSFATAIESRLVKGFAHVKCASFTGISPKALNEYFSSAFMSSDSWVEHIAELVSEESDDSVKFQYKELREPGRGMIKIFTLSDGKNSRLVAITEDGELNCSMNNNELTLYAELIE